MSTAGVVPTVNDQFSVPPEGKTLVNKALTVLPAGNWPPQFLMHGIPAGGSVMLNVVSSVPVSKTLRMPS